MPSLTPDTVISESNVYKQAWQESQRSVDNFKWAVDKAMWAIGAVLALFGFIMYKNTNEHREAIAEVRESCKDARQWEREAKSILDNISRQAKATLDEIKKEGDKKIRELIDKAEIERKISVLWNEALKAINAQEQAKVRDKCAQIIRQNPDTYEPRAYWCAILCMWAKREKNDNLSKEAHDVYDELKALSVQHKDNLEILENQIGAGAALIDFYSQKPKISAAKALLDEIEPLGKKLPEGKDRRAFFDFVKEMRQKPGMQ